MKKNTRLRNISATALALSALVLSGCSGNASGDSTSASDSTIKVGISSIQSGSVASAGLGMECAIEAYLNDANENGGVNGYDFEVVSRDHGYDPSQASQIARDFVDEDVFVMATDGSGTLNAALPVIQPEGIPVFGTADGVNFAQPEYDRLFGVNPDYKREAAAGAEFILNELGENDVALVYANSEAGQPALEAFPAYMEQNGGEVLAEEAIAIDNTDYTAQANTLQSSGADVVYSFLMDTGLAALQKASENIGYNPTWVSWFPVYTPSYLELAGSSANGTYVSQFGTPISEVDNEAVSSFTTVVGETCPEHLETQSAHSASTFAEAILRGVDKATEDGGELTQDKFVEALVGEEQALGLTPSVTWNDETRVGATKSAFYQIDEDGELVQETEYETQPESP